MPRTDNPILDFDVWRWYSQRYSQKARHHLHESFSPDGSTYSEATLVDVLRQVAG